MGAAVSLKVPKWQVNEELPPLQQFANPTIREALKERLISGDYRSLTEAGEANPALKDAIISIIGSRQIESLFEQADSSQKMGVSCAGQAGISCAPLGQSKIGEARSASTPLTLPPSTAQVKTGAGDRARKEREGRRERGRERKREKEREREREGERGGQSSQS